MNSNLKQSLTKVSNVCKDDFFLITSEYVVYKESVYERKGEASWTDTLLINEETVLANIGLHKNYEEFSKLKAEIVALKNENQRLTSESNELRKENDDLYDEIVELRNEIEESCQSDDKNDVDELSDRIQKIAIQKVKPVGQHASQAVMVQAINDLKINLIRCENKVADESLEKDITWIDERDERINELSEIISYTSEKAAGKNQFSTIYTNYRYLDFYREKYEDETVFKKEFLEAANRNNDSTKPYVRYCRWSDVFKRLPQGSYLSCTIPNSYWRLIHAKEFKAIINSWDSNSNV